MLVIRVVRTCWAKEEPAWRLFHVDVGTWLEKDCADKLIGAVLDRLVP
jgi:hypothetical protein